MTTTLPPGTLIASGARTAVWHGTCAICRGEIRPGQRVAELGGPR